MVSPLEECPGDRLARLWSRLSPGWRVGIEQVGVAREEGEAHDVEGVLEQGDRGELGCVLQDEGREWAWGRRTVWPRPRAPTGVHGGVAEESGVRRVGPSMRMVWQWWQSRLRSAPTISFLPRKPYQSSYSRLVVTMVVRRE